GLMPALRGLVDDFGKRTRIVAALEVEEPVRPLTPERQVVLYRIVQEALTNVARHSGAQHAHVHLAAENGRVRLVVEDDGRGTQGELGPHLGLLGMRERVTEMGGSLKVGPGEAGGFRLEAELPGEDGPR